MTTTHGNYARLQFTGVQGVPINLFPFLDTSEKNCNVSCQPKTLSLWTCLLLLKLMEVMSTHASVS